MVVDDGSTDDTVARLAAFGELIRVIRQPNTGVSAARNVAILAATGEFLQFLDSDNLLHAEHVEAKVRAFAAIPDADLCYCGPTDVSLFGVKPDLRQESFNTFRHEDTSPTVDLLDHTLARSYPFLVSSVTMPRHVFLQCGLFDTDLRRSEDTRYWFRLALTRPKIIGVARRLLYRCQLMNGLHATSRPDDYRIVFLRNAVDLLRIPERWAAAAEYLSGLARLLDSEDGAYEQDFHILLQVIADLPRAACGSNRSPLPLLVFLWMLSERARTPPTGRRRWVAWRELLKDSLLAAMARAEPLGQIDKDDWVSRGPRLRQALVEVVSAGVIPKLPSEIGAKVEETTAFLRGVAGAVGLKRRLRRALTELVMPRLPSEAWAKVDVFRRGVASVVSGAPRATVVVPVLANPTAAEATIASCVTQTVAGQIEILAIEKDSKISAFWSEKFPQVRVIVSPMAGNCVEAHSAGLDSARSGLIRFLMPGDILDSRSLARQIRTSRRFGNEVVVVEVKGQSSNEPAVSVRPLEERSVRKPQSMLSTMLFPLAVLSRVGGFDIALGEAYQSRYLFRLMAEGVSGAFIEANGSSIYATPPASSPNQFVIAALANLIQCLDRLHLRRHIPAVVRSLSTTERSTTENCEPDPLKTYLFKYTFNAIGELSTASHSPLAAFALCLVGLEWGRPLADLKSRPAQLETLRSTILDLASGMPLDSLSELLLSEALTEASYDPSFTNAATDVLSEVHGGSPYAGLRDALRRLQVSPKSAVVPSVTQLYQTST